MCLAATIAILGAPPAAAERLDLTNLIAPGLQVGDYKVFVDASGAWARQDVLEVSQDGERRTVSGVFVDEEGDEEPFRHSVEPGYRTWLLDDNNEPVCPPFVQELTGRQRIFELSIEPNAVERYAALFKFHTATYRLQGRLRGRQRYEGVGPLETPFGVFAEATRIETRRHVTVFKKRVFGPVEDVRFRRTGEKERLRVESWFVDGIGLVGERGLRRKYLKTGLLERVEYEYWLREASIGGARYP